MKSDHKFHFRDDEETLYDGRRLPLSAAGVNEDKMNQKIVDKNLKIINLILILFGLLSITFIVSIKLGKGKFSIDHHPPPTTRPERLLTCVKRIGI